MPAFGPGAGGVQLVRVSDPQTQVVALGVAGVPMDCHTCGSRVGAPARCAALVNQIVAAILAHFKLKMKQ